MRNLTYILFIIFVLISSCATQKKTHTNKEDDKIIIKNEELEYEIIIIEPGFNSWIVTQRPKSYYSNSTLEMRNLRWVSEWNARVLQPYRFDSNLYEMQIDYQPNIDYGIDVNYMLFMYFKYFQQKYRQKL